MHLASRIGNTPDLARSPPVAYGSEDPRYLDHEAADVDDFIDVLEGFVLHAVGSPGHLVPTALATLPKNRDEKADGPLVLGLQSDLLPLAGAVSHKQPLNLREQLSISLVHGLSLPFAGHGVDSAYARTYCQDYSVSFSNAERGFVPSVGRMGDYM